MLELIRSLSTQRYSCLARAGRFRFDVVPCHAVQFRESLDLFCLESRGVKGSQRESKGVKGSQRESKGVKGSQGGEGFVVLLF